MRALPVLAAAVALTVLPAHAQQIINRDQPVNIDADRVTVNDREKIHIFDGNVVLVQGTLTIKSDKLVVTQDTAGYHHGVATGEKGRLASFRQKRTSDGAWVDGEAERIEYNSQSERAKLFHRAQVKSAGDVVRGPYIEYDVAAENYLVTHNASAPDSTDSAPPERRVHVTIQPKNNEPKNNGKKP